MSPCKRLLVTGTATCEQEHRKSAVKKHPLYLLQKGILKTSFISLLWGKVMGHLEEITAWEKEMTPHLLDTWGNGALAGGVSSSPHTWFALSQHLRFPIGINGQLRALTSFPMRRI